MEIEIDEVAINKPAHIWAYHFFTRLGREFTIKSVKYNSELKKVITKYQDLLDLELKNHDSFKKFDRLKVDNLARDKGSTTKII